MIGLSELKEDIRQYQKDADLDLLDKAYRYALQAAKHNDWSQEQGTSEEMIEQVTDVAKILARQHLDLSCVAAGLLHASIANADQLKDIEERFGKEIAQIVHGVSEIRRVSTQVREKIPPELQKEEGTSRKEKVSPEEREKTQSELYRKMVLSMTKDLRVIFIQLAIRLVALRKAASKKESHQTTMARESLEVYAPLANRLGFQGVKVELEDLAMQILHPETFYDLQARVTKKLTERESYIEDVKKVLQTVLAKSGLSAQVMGRSKHYYSIYRKMVQKHLDFSQIFDLIAFRIILNSVPECYTALGIIHSTWTPVPGKFKDYIAVSKQNGYQSLHTAVIGPHKETMEVQIRTKEMHEVAEYGIAAHWKYKEGIAAAAKEDTKFSWLKRILDLQKESQDPKAYVDLFRLDLYEDEVYVFTPTGDLFCLPRGATPLDFAYTIHTEVGHRTTGAQVNGRIVPLKYQLRNGDKVHILTVEKQNPKKDWLNLVKTSRARTKIRMFFKQQEREQQEKLGREALEREFKRLKISLSKVVKKGELQKLAEAHNLKTVEQLYIQIGSGVLNPETLATRILPEPDKHLEPASDEAIPSSVHKPKRKPLKESSVIVVDGVENILVYFAKCCNPLAGDAIMGFITRGRGVTIHQTSCQTILDLDPARQIDVRWNPNRTEVKRIARVEVRSLNRPGMLADISKWISSQNVNIARANVQPASKEESVHLFELEVCNRQELEKILKGLKQLKGIFLAERR